MITNLIKFKKYLLQEDASQQAIATSLNSDKNTDLTNYQQKLQDYNSQKNKLQSLAQQNSSETKEVEAKKIINGNTYLGIAWKIYKMEFDLKTDELKIGKGEITSEEKILIQKNITTNKQELNKIKKELDYKIKQDLSDIKKL